MAICMVIDNPGQTRDDTERILAALRETGPVPPTGALHVMGGALDGGWRMVSVWDTRESLERFVTARLPRAFREAGVDGTHLRRQEFDVQMQSADLAARG